MAPSEPRPTLGEADGGAPGLTRRGFVAGAAVAAVGAALPTTAGARARRPRRPRAPFRPPRGRALVIAGQWPADLGGLRRPGRRDGYLDHVPVTPAGITTYLTVPSRPTPVPDGGPLAGNRMVELLRSDRLRHSLLHLSLTWAPHDVPTDERERAENFESQRALVGGGLDPWIDALAMWCKAQRRPILLRAGYEFNRLPGDVYYDRRLYVPAFRRIVRRFRARGVDNVAFVWASANLNWGAPTGSPFDTRAPDAWDFDAFYPGDDYVDWFGFSFFFPDDPDTIMLQEARRRGKPVLLAETTPAGFDLRRGLRYDVAGGHPVRLSSAEIWRAWFKPYFAFIREHEDVVAGFHYIATDWKADPFWSRTPPFVGSDARVWKDRELLERWTATLRRPPYLAGGPRLWSQLR